MSNFIDPIKKNNINAVMSNRPKRISFEVIAACAAQATQEEYLKAFNSGKEMARLVGGKVVKYRKMMSIQAM